MRNLRIIYMGTPDFAVAPLNALIENKINIVAVITAPDKPAGRGHKLSQSPVKQYAIEHNIPVLQPTNLKSEEFIEELKSYNANLQIVVAFRMLPKIVWNMPEFGTFNLHASLLPQYRGAAPINWAVINGDKESGVTTFFINEDIDTGEIILQEKVTINETDTAGILHDKLMAVGSQLVVKTVEAIKNDNINPIPQNQINSENIKPAPKIFKETCKINWQETNIEDIYNQIRGFSPYPGAWFSISNSTETISPVKIFACRKKIFNHNIEIGTIISTKDSIEIYCKGGILYLDEIQIPGKKRMLVTDYLKGHTIISDAIAQ